MQNNIKQKHRKSFNNNHLNTSKSNTDLRQGTIDSKLVPNSIDFNNQDKVIKDSLGNIYVVYYNKLINARSQIICKKSSDNGETWIDMNFPTISGYHQYHPSIAIDSNNNLHVTWYGYDVNNPGYYQVKYSKFDGTSWSNWTNISNVNGYSQVYPSIAIDSNNNLHVVWSGKDPGTSDYQIKYSKFDGTSWSNWINISNIDEDQQLYPSIAIDSNNNLHVVWQGSDNTSSGYYQVKYSKFDGTSWSNWINISNINRCYQQYPSIAIDNNNNLHVVWQGSDNTHIDKQQIKYSKFDGTSWSNWINISPTIGYNQHFPSICKYYKNFIKPIIIWYDDFSNSIQFKSIYL